MSTKVKKHVNVKETIQDERVKKLILWNDDINSFDFVIESLVEVCGHDGMRAENCTLIAHLKGKCSVKSGTFDVLKPLYTEMTNRKLTMEII